MLKRKPQHDLAQIISFKQGPPSTAMQPEIIIQKQDPVNQIQVTLPTETAFYNAVHSHDKEKLERLFSECHSPATFAWRTAIFESALLGDLDLLKFSVNLAKSDSSKQRFFYMIISQAINYAESANQLKAAEYLKGLE